MPADTFLKDLELLVRSRYALILLDTLEEERAESMLRYVAGSLDLPFFVWTASRGLRRGESAMYDTTSPVKALENIEAGKVAAIYHFQGLSPYLADQPLIVNLRDAAMQFARSSGAIIVTGSGLEVPEQLRGIATTLKLPAPDLAEYKELLDRVVRDLSTKIFVLHLKKRNQAPLRFDLDALAAASDGFSGSEIEQAVVSALYSAFSAKSDLTTPMLLAEIQGTRPLSHTLGDRLQALRAWAVDKTVSAE